MEAELRRNKALWELFEAIVRLTDRDECAKFFRDLCTLTELEEMAERWEVARLIAQEMSYRQISELTGSSTATITRIAHWLHHGEGGYRLMLERVGAPGRGKGAHARGTAAERA
jgi:TrpR-related protein YerC/YecD